MTCLRAFLAGLARRAGWVRPVVPWRELFECDQPPSHTGLHEGMAWC